MQRLVYPAILIALAASSAIAAAQQPLPANQRYCLEANGPNGGPHPLLCRFETLEQCFASKTAQGDACMLNPILAFQRR